MRHAAFSLRHTMFLALAAAGSMGCSKDDAPDAKRTWACSSEAVPMGEAIRCTSAAMTATSTLSPVVTDPTTGATPVAPLGTPQGSSDSTTIYDCAPGSTSPDCPPPDASSSGSGSGSGSSPAPTDGAGSGGTTGSTGGTTGSSSGGSSSGGSSSGGSSSGGSSSGANGSSESATGHGNGGGNGNGNGNASSGGAPGKDKGSSANGNGGPDVPDECNYVSDLPYCPPGSGTDGSSSNGSSAGGSSSSSSGGTSSSSGGTSSSSGGASSSSSGGASSSSSGGASHPGNGGSNGNGSSGSHGHGASSSSGGSSSGSSSGDTSGNGGSAGGGTGYHCTKDKDGNATCTSSTPTTCAPGTHPAPCGACVSDSESCDCVPPTEGGCWVTGGGFIVDADGHDNFGGNAKPMKQGYVSGHWNHVDHGTMNHAKGRPEYIYCRVDATEPGPGQPGGKKGLVFNQVYFGGHAQWRDATAGTWADGYWFDVVAEDHGNGHQSAAKGQDPDWYHFTIRKMDDPAAKVSGAIVYETKGDLVGGKIQIHPPNGGHPATQSALPSWVAIENAH